MDIETRQRIIAESIIKHRREEMTNIHQNHPGGIFVIEFYEDKFEDLPIVNGVVPKEFEYPDPGYLEAQKLKTPIPKGYWPIILKCRQEMSGVIFIKKN